MFDSSTVNAVEINAGQVVDSGNDAITPVVKFSLR
jgi:hypothetical protein